MVAGNAVEVSGSAGRAGWIGTVGRCILLAAASRSVLVAL